MMIKKIFILLLAVIALFMGPQYAMARAVVGVKVCCQKMSSQKSCCKDKQKEATTKKHCKGDGKSCSCGSTIDGKTSLFFHVAESDIFLEFSEKQQKYFYQDLFHSSDARAIWLPPKIS